MSDKGRKVLKETLTLPPEERADLAAELIESLDEREDEAVEEARGLEIQQRMREVESGAVKTIPWSEVRKGILGLRGCPHQVLSFTRPCGRTRWPARGGPRA